MKNHLGRALALLLALALLAAACGGDNDATPSESTDGEAETLAGEGLVIGYAGLSSEFPFVADVNAGLQSAADAIGAELIILDNAFDPQVALTNADLLIQQGANVIIEFQTDEAIAPALCEKFATADLDTKVIAIDIPHEPCAAFYGADNRAAGAIAGEQLALIAQERWGSIDKVVLLSLPQSGELVVSRTLGYVDGIREVFPDFDDADVIDVDGGGGLEASLTVMQDLLATLTDSDRIVVGAVNDPSAVGALRAIQGAGREDAFLIGGQNATIEGRVEICNNSSVFVGSVGYFPENYGQDLVDLAVRLHNGETIDDFNFVDHVWIDNSNIREFYPNC